MPSFSKRLVLTIAALLVAGCSGSSPSNTSSLPSVNVTHAGIPVPGFAKDIYVADPSAATVLGYDYVQANIGNAAPNCLVGTQPTNIATSGDQNLIEIAGLSISVYGHGWCGGQIGTSVTDTYGKPQDAASNVAAKGNIAVATFDGLGTGSLTICTLPSHACNHDYTNAAMTQEAVGVAMTNNGNCFVTAFTFSTPVLVYFAHCSGGGVVATGFQNTSAGGLDIDHVGNLVSVDPNANEIWVYKGCPVCVNLTNSPLVLNSGSTVRYAHVNGNSTKLAAANAATHSIDVYKYGSTVNAVNIWSYWHSFNNGMTSSWGVGWLPRSSQ